MLYVEQTFILDIMAVDNLLVPGIALQVSASDGLNNGSDNGLSPGRRQAIIWTIVGILLISPLGTNFCEMLIKINISSSKKMHLKMLSAKWWQFCLSFYVVKHHQDIRTKNQQLFVMDSYN